MRVVCYSDFHGNLPDEMPEGDLLLYAGDFCPTLSHHLGYQRQYVGSDWSTWLQAQPYDDIVGIAGNHDFIAEEDPEVVRSAPWTYLCDESVEVGGFLIHGAPWSARFYDWAFMRDDVDLAERWAQIPDETNILLVHGPPYGFGDFVFPPASIRRQEPASHKGSRTLMARIGQLKNLQLVVFGHIHEGAGTGWFRDIQLVNASRLDAHYRPVHEPTVLDIEAPPKDQQLVAI